MEKQHNRGQDGAGIANIKFDVEPGTRYISRYRSNHKQAIADIFRRIQKRFEEAGKQNPALLNDTQWLKKNLPFTGELWLGHLRYGTYGGNSVEACHPFLRQNNWMTKNLVVAGNFNMTNVDELFQDLISLGQHPKEKADTVTVMENIGHFLDEENEEMYLRFRQLGNSKQEISPLIAEHIDVAKILRNSSKSWDGGYEVRVSHEAPKHGGLTAESPEGLPCTSTTATTAVSADGRSSRRPHAPRRGRTRPCSARRPAA